VDANARVTNEMVNSAAKGTHFDSFCGNGFGDAKCDRGSVRRSRRTGRSKRIAGKERCDRMASVKRERDDWPRQHQKRKTGKAWHIPCAANMRVSNWRVFSTVDVESARQGRKMYGLRR